ncbi:putative secreted protein (Por secretion system target) [Roseivirga ehrenbergii]|uniref:Secretion system C-terminal sorting domain-containing protein n=1 Tax=Roseivirga ehrenbergii (strain DSM 102268 / JCM 13514 / KCTC 12282 / NCIMB 14502 / KMM 6017) TaxID=279360 RepID=A0A150WYX7_ROSEK|nr:T9SS type A sorting domain-containing protein [Roseivirga ehrenbergii]KYG71626.1 hypothetical protein MB14_09920 [Roseivirga ehrenbergii]TCL07685.1 putative secreted protein (Por secretion system target) [Roseivirga ehrenbergii]
MPDGILFSTNYPNPFSTETKIEYSLPSKTGQAKVILYDENGIIVKEYSLDIKGKKGILTISKDNMKSGIYYYAMIVNDQVVGTKKMIVR